MWLLTLVQVLSAAVLLQPGDQKVHFVNPSFEGAGGESRFPSGWSSKTPDSTPDIMPGAWNISFAPYQGKTCVGLVTRDNGTVEDMGQTLTTVLQNGSCYSFSIWLAHTNTYVGYNAPVRLRVWGGSTPGAKTILLASTPLVTHADWKEYKLQFIAKQNIRHITLEAYFGPGMLTPYKGNIFLDNCSPLEKCDRA